MAAQFTSIEESEALLRGIAQGTKDLIAAEDKDFRYLYFNDSYAREFKKLWGADLEIGTSMVEAMASWPEEQEKARQLWQRALQGETFSIRMDFGPSELQKRYYDLRFNPILNSNGDLIGAAHILSDVTSQVKAERHRDLLIQELNHRVKNTLSVVQAIARQTFSDSRDVKTARTAFEARLANLATAHDLLTRSSWEKTTLSQVIEMTMIGAGVSTARFHAEGPMIVLGPDEAVSLAMAVHELATNATKYGSLSNENGKVQIEWMAEAGAGSSFKLVWKEKNGPAVVAPQQSGFGTILIREALAHELSGDVSIEFQPDGLLCIIKAPLSAEN